MLCQRRLEAAAAPTQRHFSTCSCDNDTWRSRELEEEEEEEDELGAPVVSVAKIQTAQLPGFPLPEFELLWR